MMKRTITCVACVAALALTACTGESNFPVPTGKGTVSGINAIPGSPTVTFSIEERPLGFLTYKSSSSPAAYDDFLYNFNFDIEVPGEDDPQRIATVATQVEDGRDYVFVLSGDLANPIVTTWDTAERSWDDAETVFEAWFAHLAVSLGDVDVYFYDESGPAPVQGEQVATLSYGDVMDKEDFPEAAYVVLVTAAGDISTVYHQSSPTTLAARTSQLISLFDGDANDTSPYMLRSMSSTGLARRWPDPAYPPTIRFIHGSSTLSSVDVYNDETLTTLVASNVTLGEATADFADVTDEVTWHFTPAGNTGTILFSYANVSIASKPNDLYLVGTAESWTGVKILPDRASAETIAKVSLFNSAFDAGPLDLYIVDRDATVTDDTAPTLSLLGYGLSSGAISLATGSYDLLVTTAFTKTVLGGPYALDVALGDVVELLAYDDELNPDFVIIGDVSPP